MRSLICRKLCNFFKPHRDEPEKCLGFELLSLWSEGEPGLAGALGQLPAPAHPSPASLAQVSDSICACCVFRAHGCDFAAGLGRQAVSPCGGALALAALLDRGSIHPGDMARAWDELLARCYLRLAEHVSLRRLESPCLYDRLADELYEVNEEAWRWLCRCDGAVPGLAREADAGFLEELFRESLLACTAEARPRPLRWRQSPIPSLRYLELMLTERCNLRCAHCYLGEAGQADLPLATVLQVLAEFQEMQGLRVLLSGGEPLLYPWWEELNRRLPEFELRFILLSNGSLLTEEVISQIQVQEVQISLDGLQPGHELLRGRGTWQKTIAHLRAAKEAGLDISVATMIHRGNVHELAELGEYLQHLGVREWNLDVPCVTGRLAAHADLYLDPAEAAPYLDLGFGGSDHGSEGDFACGLHLAAVLSSGQVAKCGLFGDQPLGRVEEGLEACWALLKPLPLSELQCGTCPHLGECRGGCRFRAGDLRAPDPVMCARFGIKVDTIF